MKIFNEPGLDRVDIYSMFSPGGHQGIQESREPRNLPKFAETIGRVREGSLPSYTVQQMIEAQGTSEFQWYMGHILQRRTYGMYEKMRAPWRSYVAESTVPDFRKVERLWRNDAAAPMDFLQEFEAYPYTGVTGDKTEYQVAKYGRNMGLSWEDLINDDLNFLDDFPQTLSNSAVMTEDLFVTRLYSSGSGGTGGPRASVFTSDNLLQTNEELGLTNANAPLSLDAVKAAMFQMEQQTIGEDDNDLPIMFSSFVVVVPHALSLVVDFLRNTREIRAKDAADAKGSNQYEFIMDGRRMIGNVEFVVNPYLDRSSRTAWYMFAMPTNARPGIEVAYLRGHRRPQIFMRRSDSRPLGGGDDRGSFENDTLDYKIRGVFGGAVIDKRQMVASAGTG